MKIHTHGISPSHVSKTLTGGQRRVWHRSAPSAVRRAYHTGGAEQSWKAWVMHLGKRDRPVPLEVLLPGTISPLAWAAMPEPHAGGRCELPVHYWRDRVERRPEELSASDPAQAWLAEDPQAVLDPSRALEALAWCHALPPAAAGLPRQLWWEILDRLAGSAAEAGAIDLAESPLAHQLLAGELPLTLAYLFPEITHCRKLAGEARRALTKGLVDLCDGEGLPHGRWIGLVRPLLACWTRCRALGSQLRKGCWSADAQSQYEWLVRNAIRLTRGDGTHVFWLNGAGDGAVAAPSGAGAWCQELFTAALRLGGNRDDFDIAAIALPGGKKSAGRRARLGALPEAASHSEWAATAVLRSEWPPNKPRLTVAWPDRSVQMELECRGDVLWSGRWELDVRIGGRRLDPEDEWSQVCWISDQDVDYLELEMDLCGNVRVQRQLLLARQDRFLFLADAITAKEAARLESRQCLPISDHVTFQEADQTQEGYLVGRTARARVLPLALPEWRIDPSSGSLGRTDNGLELCHSTQGSALLAPWFLDLKPRRMVRPLTWRGLTVAENRQILPAEVAVGYRVMAGREQWLIYRSLAKTGNRTLLGHNLVSEFLVARFTRKGEVEPLVEIE